MATPIPAAAGVRGNHDSGVIRRDQMAVVIMVIDCIVSVMFFFMAWSHSLL
jgi:hypothetical protein